MTQAMDEKDASNGRKRSNSRNGVIVVFMVSILSFWTLTLTHEHMLPKASVYHNNLPFHGLSSDRTSWNSKKTNNTKMGLGDFAEFRALSIQSSLEKDLPNFSQFLTQYEHNNTNNKNSSPRERALNWLIYEDTRTPPDRADLYQRYILAVLFYSSNQPWKHGNLHFLSPLHECHWYRNIHRTKKIGVHSCNDNMLIKQIFLPAMNIEGTIPEELGYLGASTLTKIDLQNNNLHGTIPTTLGLLTNLQNLELNHNSLEGTIPSQLGQLHQIQNILLQFNNIHGPDNTFPSEYFIQNAQANFWTDCARSTDPIICTSCNVCCDSLSTCEPQERNTSTNSL